MSLTVAIDEDSFIELLPYEHLDKPMLGVYMQVGHESIQMNLYPEEAVKLAEYMLEWAREASCSQ